MDGVRANVSSSNDYVTLGLYRKVIAQLTLCWWK